MSRVLAGRAIRRVGRCFLSLALLAAAACAGGREGSTDAGRAPRPIPTDWRDRDFRANLEKGWSVRNCATDPPVLCVTGAGKPAGSVRLMDLPTLGEEKTTSADQVQAVLAGRINSLYQWDMNRWLHGCGELYKVTWERPQKIALGGREAMKYEIRGSNAGRTVETLVGYWTFRQGIETVIEASAPMPGRCEAESLGQVSAGSAGGALPQFSPEALSRFEPLLDRMVAGSRLPPPTRFTAGP